MLPLPGIFFKGNTFSLLRKNVVIPYRNLFVAKLNELKTQAS